MPSASEIPWLEDLGSVDDTATIKIDPVLNDGSVMHTFGPDRWECLQLNTDVTEELSTSEGLILEITKQTIAHGSGPGYVFVEDVMDRFDLSTVDRRDPPEPTEPETESSSDTTDESDQSQENPSDTKEYSPQKTGQKLNHKESKTDPNKMREMDNSRF